MTEKTPCKYCSSNHTRKYGRINHVQRFFCNDCRRTFKKTPVLFHIGNPVKAVVFQKTPEIGLNSLDLLKPDRVQLFIDPSGTTVSNRCREGWTRIY